MPAITKWTTVLPFIKRRNTLREAKNECLSIPMKNASILCEQSPLSVSLNTSITLACSSLNISTCDLGNEVIKQKYKQLLLLFNTMMTEIA